MTIKKRLPLLLIRVAFLALFIFLVINGKTLLWLVLFGVSLVLGIFFGRLYCGYMCPINTVMMPVSQSTKKRGGGKDAPKWLESGKVAWISLAVSVAIYTFTRLVLQKNFPVLLIWLVLAVVVTLRYKPYVFHNKICPFGVLQRLFARSPRFSQYVDKIGCDGCRDCEKVCPAEAIKVKADEKAEIDSQACLQCKNCEFICHTKTIKYGETARQEAVGEQVR
ncbi:MAG: 4Fe-4S binding protein [Eubacteriales bacterium]|nr:4Fe-4S binding protein [Eubacteriales bacterium]